jgi:hypothetical protein
VISFKIILDLHCIFTAPSSVRLVLNQDRADNDRFMFELHDEVSRIRSANCLGFNIRVGKESFMQDFTELCLPLIALETRNLEPR